MKKTYKEIREEFYSRYKKPVLEPLVVGYSGIDPPLKPQVEDEEHEELTNLLGGNENGHYHLTGKEYQELQRILSYLRR